MRLKYGEFFLECDSSHHLPRILAVLPDLGRRLTDIVLALDVREPCVIDIGANIGDTALLLARFAPGARVLCIEGDARFIPDLTLNTSQVDGRHDCTGRSRLTKLWSARKILLPAEPWGNRARHA